MSKFKLTSKHPSALSGLFTGDGKGRLRTWRDGKVFRAGDPVTVCDEPACRVTLDLSDARINDPVNWSGPVFSTDAGALSVTVEATSPEGCYDVLAASLFAPPARADLGKTSLPVGVNDDGKLEQLVLMIARDQGAAANWTPEG